MSSSAATDARLMIDTTLRATSEKLWPGGFEDLRRPAQLVGAEAREEVFDGCAAGGAGEVAARRFARRSRAR